MTAALRLHDTTSEQLDRLHTPFMEAVHKVTSNLDAALDSWAALLASDPTGRANDRELEARTLAACDGDMALFSDLLDWWQFLASPAFQREIRRRSPDKAERYGQLVARMMTWQRAVMERLEKRRALIAEAERLGPELGLTVDQILDNPLVQYAEQQSDEQRAHAALGLAVSRDAFGSDRAAEMSAYAAGSHPLHPAHRAERQAMFGGSAVAELRAWQEGTHPLKQPG